MIKYNYYFLFGLYFLLIHVNKSLSSLTSQMFPPVISSRSFTVLAFATIYFHSLLFVIWEEDQSLLFPHGCPIIPGHTVHCVEKMITFLSSALSTFVKIQLTDIYGSISGFYFAPMIHLSTFVPITTVLITAALL